jgi:hypothetical protein
MGVEENNAMALIAHEDFNDYFKRKGFSIFGAMHVGNEHLSVTYRNDDYRELNTRQYWSFFGGRKLFRENAPISVTTVRSIALTSFFDNARERRMYSGTQALLDAEFGLGNHHFRSYTLDIRRYQPLMRWLGVNTRLFATAITGENVPLQHYALIGGPSTMPAFDFKEFGGNRAVVVNAEAIVSGRLLDALVWFPFKDMSVIVMIDAGAAAMADSALGAAEGWNEISMKSLHSDVGFALGSANGLTRLGWVWRMDRNEGARFFLRLARPF